MKSQIITTWFLLSALLTGCATTPQSPPEAPISVKLQGTAVEVQYFIEDRFRKNQTVFGLRIENANDRAITFKGDCTNIQNMNTFKCAAIMMAVGNSRWDGPFAVLTFRTAEIRGIVNLTLNAEWCATNTFGKTNCIPNGSNAERNNLLRKIKAAYEQEVRPLDNA